eukprot:g1260.t1
MHSLAGLNDVVHKATVLVNEEGTVAAAATGAVMATRCLPPPAMKVTVDRPFLFGIRSFDSNFCKSRLAILLFLFRGDVRSFLSKVPLDRRRFLLSAVLTSATAPPCLAAKAAAPGAAETLPPWAAAFSHDLR